MASGLSESVFFLPDTLANWPWTRTISPFYLQAQADSSAWIQSFKIFTAAGEQRAFDLCNFNLLASLGYPLENQDIIRAGTDLMSLFSVFDHYTDVATPHEVQQMADMVMDAIRNPDKARPANECVVGEVARQFWKLSMRYASEGASRRFIESIDEYTASVVQEAEDRAQSYIRSIDEYFHVRRKTVGVKPSLALFQFGLNLPDDVLEDPIIERLTNACIDMIILDNDLYSYNVEQARGDAGHNIITIVMHQKKIGLSEAVNWIGDHHSKLGQQFLNDLKHVPHFDKMIELDVKHYLDGLGNWVRANECWSFESHRYFGMSGREVQQSRKVVLLPRSAQICSTKI